jgi:hypothetical protein
VAGLAGLLLSDVAIWSSILLSPTKYCYRTADGIACFHDLATCEAEQKLADEPLTTSCRWEDDPFAERASGPVGSR